MFEVFERKRPIKFSSDAVLDFGQFVRELAQYCHDYSGASASLLCHKNFEESENKRAPFTAGVCVGSDKLFDLIPLESLNAQIRDVLERNHELCLDICSETGRLGDRRRDDSESVVSIIDGTNSILWIRPLTAQTAILSICETSSENCYCMDLIRNAHATRKIIAAKQDVEQQQKNSRNVIRLATGISGSLPLAEQAYQQANEIRRFLECDRVSIFDINNSSATALAVSGQPRFNRRSNSIRIGQEMVGRIAHTGEPFWFSGNFDDLADSLKETIQRYTDESLVNSFVLLPLIEIQNPVFPSEEETMQEAISPGAASTKKTIGAVLVEQIEDVIEQQQVQQRWDEIEPVVVNQYNNSRKYDSIFLIRFWTLLGRFTALYRGQTKRKAILITSLIAVVLLGALLIPSDFKVRCEGYLVYKGTTEIYAKSDGNVVQLNVTDGKAVKKGEILLVQQNMPLATENVKLIGEVSQLETEIEDLNDSRVGAALGQKSEADDDSQQLGHKVHQLETELLALRRQQNLVQTEMDQLIIRAPFDGTISGWKTERRLLDRPLEKGDHLFTLIPVDAEFKLELRVPDQRAGYVQTAWLRTQKEEEKLPVAFRLASAPGLELDGVVKFVSPGLERDEHIGYTLPILVATTGEIPASDRKSKTAVMAKVICGRRSYAYCKSYEAIDWFKSKLFEFTY